MPPILSQVGEASDDRAPFASVGELRLPGYQPTRTLSIGRCGARILATRQRDREQVVLHAVRRSLRRGVGRLAGGRLSRDARRFVELVAPLRGLSDTHILPVEDVVADASGYHWLVTPYLGSSDGLLTLERLQRLRENNQLGEHETERAVEHLLAATEAAHGRGLVHGAIRPDEVLVNRHGSLAIELYGLARRLGVSHSEANSDVSPVRAELRSVAEIAYTLLTGTMEAPEPFIPATRLVKRLSPRWDAWLSHGLDPSRGFDSAAEARRFLPSGDEELPRLDDADRDNRPDVQSRRVAIPGLAGWKARAARGANRS